MAGIIHEAHLVGNQNELQNWSQQKLSSDPTPFEGQVWLNTTDNKLKYYDGTTIHTLADLGDVAGLLDFKGDYNAATNTPDLDTTPIATLKGDYYIVSAAGNFFTEAVSVGDSIFAKQDSPTTLKDDNQCRDSYSCHSHAWDFLPLQIVCPIYLQPLI